MSTKEYYQKDLGILSPSKTPGLNPNAAEFIPSSLRSLDGPVEKTDTSSTTCKETSEKVLHRSDSNVSNNSEDEAGQYWCHQLPDDITPDFKATEETLQQMHSDLSLLSLHNKDGVSHFATAEASRSFGNRRSMPHYHADASDLSQNFRYSSPRYSGDQSSSGFPNFSNIRELQFQRSDPYMASPRESLTRLGSKNSISPNSVMNNHTDVNANPLEVLLSQFPDISAQILLELYYANRCDLNTTIESLRRMKVDDGFGSIISSKTLSSPNLSTLDFPAFAMPDMQSGLLNSTGKFFQPPSNTYSLADKDFALVKSSPFASSMDAINPVSAVQRVPSQNLLPRKYDRSHSAKFNVGSSRNTEYLSSHSGDGRSIYNAKMRSLSGGYAVPSFRSGDVNDVFTDMEMADDYGPPNANFIQAGEAFSAGKRGLSSELFDKGQLYTMQTKVSHEKSRQGFLRHSSLATPDVQVHSSIQDPIINLQGFHTNEAMYYLKLELSNWRRKARSSGRRLQVAIFVGDHAKGSPTLAGLPIAIEQYLIEEGLPYSEPQPGLLRVTIY